MRIRDPFVHIQESHKTTKLDAIIYIHKIRFSPVLGSVHTASGFLSLYELCSVDLEKLAFLVSSIHFVSLLLAPPLPQHSLSS